MIFFFGQLWQKLVKSTSSYFFKNFRLAKHSDETSSCGIPSGSNTPQVADTCDPRISQGLEILQRYEVTDCNIVFILGPTTYYL